MNPEWRPTRARTAYREADRHTVPAVAERERWHALAAFYAYQARHDATPPGRDPMTGDKWQEWARINGTFPARRIGRAMYAAAAREAFRIARTFGPSPLP